LQAGWLPILTDPASAGRAAEWRGLTALVHDSVSFLFTGCVDGKPPGFAVQVEKR